MFIMAKRSILLPSKDHSKVFPVARGFTGEIPDWAAETGYFKELVQDNKIVVPESKRDKDLQDAAETPEPGNAPGAPAKDSDGQATESPAEEKTGDTEEKTKKSTKTK